MSSNRPKKDFMNLRFSLTLGVLFCAVAAVIFQAYRIQIQNGPGLREDVQHIYNQKALTIPTRGSIFDRNGVELAISIPVDSVYARPDKAENIRASANRLSKVLDMEPSTILKKLEKDAPFVWIKRKVVPPESIAVRELDLPGIGVVQESRRFYPHLELGCHLLGFVGTDPSGLEGLEYAYDKYLKGEKNVIVVNRDALGRSLASLEEHVVYRKDGNHLLLTIHNEIQYLTVKHLHAAVEATGAKGGMAVVMDPRTGEILAMANVPYFNPNTFTSSSSESRRNLCVTYPYEPGSTFKPFLAAAAVEEGAAKPEDTIYCENGSFNVGEDTIHDVEPHGLLTLKDIVRESSNIGAAKVGLGLGADVLHQYIWGFGFGHSTGVDLPGEAAGVLRPPDIWSPMDLATISFGHGISTTALQIATAFSALANQGRLMRPYVVKEIIDSHGKLIKKQRPVFLRQVVSPDTAATVTQMLIEAVNDGGTGTKAAIEGYLVAGKTGTAQKPDIKYGGYKKGRYMASFVGYVPAEKPKLCILVALDEPKGMSYGGQVAAPVFREIAIDTLGILGITPDRKLLAEGPN